jgi:hypothetical protein
MKDVKCGKSGAVGGQLGHKFSWSGLNVKLQERFLFLWRVSLVSNGSYSYPSGICRDHMINAISLEEERGRAPHLSVEQER